MNQYNLVFFPFFVSLLFFLISVTSDIRLKELSSSSKLNNYFYNLLVYVNRAGYGSWFATFLESSSIYLAPLKIVCFAVFIYYNYYYDLYF